MFLQANNSLHPYINLALQLKSKTRKGYGTMFRHQLETFAILVEYGFTDSVLLKASLIHDVVEDVPDFNEQEIIAIDDNGHVVFQLVQEVTKRKINGIDESKTDFILRIMKEGSEKARVLKLADRISNVASLCHSGNIEFITRYLKETNECIIPFAKAINEKMHKELTQIILQTQKHFNLK